MARRPKGAEDADRERDEFLDAVGHRIKLARVQADLTQRQLADKIGAQQAWVYLAEDGQQNLQLSSLRKIAEALGVSVRDLLPEGSESGPEYDAVVESNETVQKLIGQLTDALGALHRLQALNDRRKRSGRPVPQPPKPKWDA